LDLSYPRRPDSDGDDDDFCDSDDVDESFDYTAASRNRHIDDRLKETQEALNRTKTALWRKGLENERKELTARRE
jgi:hypothetical protein